LKQRGGRKKGNKGPPMSRENIRISPNRHQRSNKPFTLIEAQKVSKFERKTFGTLRLGGKKRNEAKREESSWGARASKRNQIKFTWLKTGGGSPSALRMITKAQNALIPARWETGTLNKGESRGQGRQDGKKERKESSNRPLRESYSFRDMGSSVRKGKKTLGPGEKENEQKMRSQKPGKGYLCQQPLQTGNHNKPSKATEIRKTAEGKMTARYREKSQNRVEKQFIARRWFMAKMQENRVAARANIGLHLRGESEKKRGETEKQGYGSITKDNIPRGKKRTTRKKFL